jgi:hypothetical protein
MTVHNDNRPPILDWLKENPGWHTVREISQTTGYAPSAVQGLDWQVEQGTVARWEDNGIVKYAACQLYGKGSIIKS